MTVAQQNALKQTLKSLTLRGSLKTSSPAFSSTMQQHCYFAFLCSLLFASLASSSNCTETQYPGKPNLCCDKCQPGYYLDHRCSVNSPTKCRPCAKGRYRNTYNVERSCDFCENCNTSNLEYKSQCNSTHNAVCKCKSGYKCKDQHCKMCVPVPPTTTAQPTPTPFNTASTTNTIHAKQKTQDTLWLLIILLSIGTAALGLVTLQTTLLSLMSKCHYFLVKTQEPESTCSEDEEVTKPVQEAGNVPQIKMDP